MIYAKGWKIRDDGRSENFFYRICEDKDKEQIRDWVELEMDNYVIVYSLSTPNETTESFNTVEEAEKRGHHIAREITHEEFSLYMNLKSIIREVWMHDFTGGYPNEGLLQSHCWRLKKSVDEFIDAIKED